MVTLYWTLLQLQSVELKAEAGLRNVLNFWTMLLWIRYPASDQSVVWKYDMSSLSVRH